MGSKSRCIVLYISPLSSAPTTLASFCQSGRSRSPSYDNGRDVWLEVPRSCPSWLSNRGAIDEGEAQAYL